MLTEVPAEMEHDAARILVGQFAQNGQRSVGAAVVHEYDLERPIECLEGGDQSAMELGNR